MYSKPQDIVSDLLKEDVDIDIQTPTSINFKPDPREDDLGIDIEKDKDVHINPQLGVKITNNNERTVNFEMNVRKALNGDLLVFDHADIDIIVMPEMYAHILMINYRIRFNPRRKCVWLS